MANLMRYLFIFNPAADKGRASRKSRWLANLLSRRDDSSMVETCRAGHAGEIAGRETGKNTSVIACGGDGTLHEVVNALAGESVKIGILPVGSANDFIKSLDPGRSRASGVSHFFDALSRRVDLGRVSYGNEEERYFINSLGIGFTGRVAKAVKSASWLKGELGYLYALFSVLIGYTPPKMHIKITGEDSLWELHEPVFAFSVSNGRVEGGKFRIAPQAEISDGLLDVCILKAVSKYEFFRYVLKYLDGSQIHDSKVLYCKARAVEVGLSAPDVMHMDGEVYDGIEGRVSITVVPEGVHMLCGIQEDAKP
ncbi:MAG: diacylglycerol kinase family protein [Chlorobiaceae bacterium]